MTFVFERQTTEIIYVRAEDEDTARELLEELSESEWYIVDESECDLIWVEKD